MLVEDALALFGPLRLRFCPLQPTARQEAFLLMQDTEVFYGGSAGGGKSAALLMSALQYCDVPGYHALIVRPSLTEFHLAGGLINLTEDWLAGTRASWNGDTSSWRFPGLGPGGSDGASLTFGYLADVNLARYHGASFSFLGFDELTRFSEAEYLRMFRVVRQPHGAPNQPAAADGTTLDEIPVRIRSTSNPGGPGHYWVKERFVDPESRQPGAVYVASKPFDNPHLNQANYTPLLARMLPADRERLLHGNWDIPDDGEIFQRDWFPVIERHQLPEKTRAVRYWDLAGTEPGPANRDPDYTVGLRLELHPKSGSFYITDIVRERLAAGAVESLVARTARADGRTIPICIEQEGGSAGKNLISTYKRHILRGYIVAARRPTGPKDVRARPVAAAAGSGLISIVRGRHTHAFLDELTAFPHGTHDDCIDALAGAYTELTDHSGGGTTHVPQGRIPTQRRTLAGPRRPTITNDYELGAALGVPVYLSHPHHN